MPTPSTHTFCSPLADSPEELQADINPNDEGGRRFLILRILKLYALGLRLMPKQESMYLAVTV